MFIYFVSKTTAETFVKQTQTEVGATAEYWLAVATCSVFAMRTISVPSLGRLWIFGMFVGYMASSFDEFKVSGR